MAWNIEREGEFFNKEILKYPEANAPKRNGVIDSAELSTFADQPSGRKVLPAGTLLVAHGSDVDEVQRISITGTPTGGTFKLKWNDHVTGTIAYDASGATVETALEALTNLETADVTDSGGPLPGTAIDITFGGAYSGKNVAQLEVADNSLTGGSDPQVVIETITQGKFQKVKPAPTSGASGIVGFLAYTIEFFGTGAAKYDEPCAIYFRDVVLDRQKLINYSGNASEVATALPSIGIE